MERRKRNDGKNEAQPDAVGSANVRGNATGGPTTEEILDYALRMIERTSVPPPCPYGLGGAEPTTQYKDYMKGRRRR